MFEDLRAAFREAVDNFNKELSRDQVPETVDRLIGGMVDELTSAKAHVSALESDLEKTLAAAEREKAEAATCRRREEMARKIDDNETADLAAQYAEKHEGHQRVLEQKAVALKAELDFMTAEVQQMMAKVKEARDKKASMAATSGRSSARGTLSEADELFSELDRMAEKIDGEQREGEAAEAMGSVDMGYDPLDTRIDTGPPPPPDDIDFDDRLAKLKRRMNQD